MTSKIAALVAAFAVMVGTTPASAQEGTAAEAPSVVVGSRVRVFSRENLASLTGSVLAIDDESITLGLGRNAVFRIPRLAIGSIEVSRGRLRRAVKGALLGIGMGAILGAVAHKPDPVGCAQGVAVCSRRAYTAGVVAVGAGFGVALGSLDHWEPVALDSIQLGIRAERSGASATVSVGF